ncbi:MAG: hypothetical protein MJ252_11880 [archaeon]|nr:hypothetical protein [archaeon]
MSYLLKNKTSKLKLRPTSSLPIMNISANPTSTNYNKPGGLFYRKERRFIEAEHERRRLAEGPGPGTYIHAYSAVGKSNTFNYNGRYVDTRTGKKLEDCNKRPISTRERFPVNKESIEIGIPVGKYYPAKIFSIEYNNHFRGLKFEKVYDQFNPILIRENVWKMSKVRTKDKGTDLINFDKPVLVCQELAPFNTTASRFRTITKLNKEKEEVKSKIGPGKYDYSDCYPWIKKSFNKNFQSH